MRKYAILDENNIVVDVRYLDILNPEETIGIVRFVSTTEGNEPAIGSWFNPMTLEYETR